LGPQRTFAKKWWALKVLRTRTIYGDHSFSVSSAMLWNKLPKDLTAIDDSETFENNLKRWLFMGYYENQ
jgi:hypothetical protein